MGKRGGEGTSTGSDVPGEDLLLLFTITIRVEKYVLLVLWKVNVPSF